MNKECRLLVRAKNGDPLAQNELLRRHGRLIYSLARKRYRWGAFLELEELVQQGSLGLLHAIKKFDVKRRSNGKPVGFATYACYWIEHEIRRAIHNHGRTVSIPVRVQQDFQTFQRVIEKARMEENKEIDFYAFAQGLSLSDKRRESLCQADERIMALEDLSEEWVWLHGGTPPIPSSPDEAESPAHEQESVNGVRWLVARLPHRERHIIERLYGLCEGEKPKTVSELAQAAGLSDRRVRQLRAGALRKMKDQAIKMSL